MSESDPLADPDGLLEREEAGPKDGDTGHVTLGSSFYCNDTSTGNHHFGTVFLTC